MRRLILYCEPCRAQTNLDKTPHKRIPAPGHDTKCELCGTTGRVLYSNAYPVSKIKRAIRDMQDYIERQKAHILTDDEIEREILADVDNPDAWEEEVFVEPKEKR